MATSVHTSGLPMELYNTLNAIVQKFQSEDENSDQVVVMKDNIIDACKKHKFCSPRTFHVKNLGPHPSNRDGEGLAPNRAQTRVKVIVKGGCSKPTLRPNCVAMEDDPDTRKVAKFTMEVIAGSEKFAKLELHDIKAGTLGAGHATHGFAMVHDEVPCDIPEISENGRMSKNKCFKDLVIKDLVENGIEFDTIDYRVERAFPVIPHIIQSALNVVQQVSEGESWHQLLMKVVNEAQSQGDKVNWPKVKKDVLKSQPPRPQDIPDMADFIAKFGGLPTGSHIKELSELASTYCPSDRFVSGALFAALAAIKFPASLMPADLMCAIVYTCAQSNQNIRDGVAQYITSANVSCLAKTEKLPDVAKANLALQRARSLMDVNTVAKHHRLRLISSLKVALCEAVLARKGSPEERSIDQIVQDFVLQLQGLVDGSTTVGTDVGKDEAKGDDQKSDGKAHTHVVTYDKDGAANNIGSILIEAKGVQIGCTVKEAKCKDKWQLLYVSNVNETSGDVELKHYDPVKGTIMHDTLLKVTRDTFIDTYTKVLPPGEDPFEVKTKVFPITFHYQSGLDHLINQGIVADALVQLLHKFPHPDIRIFVKPERRVLAQTTYPEGKLNVVPYTQNMRKVDGEANPHTLVTITEGREGKVSLAPYETHDTVSPFWPIWAVRVTDKEKAKDANCTMKAHMVKGKGVTTNPTKNPNKDFFVEVNCITNTKEIKTGEPIVLYVPEEKAAAKRSGEKTIGNLASGAPAKRQKQ